MTPPFDHFGTVEFADEEELIFADDVLELVPHEDGEEFAGTGIYYAMSNEAYHSGPGVSKSGLDLIAVNPSAYIWHKQAPVDYLALQALDLGSALHCALLEPTEFEKRFIVAPEFNRRATAGREAESEFLAQAYADGMTPLTHEDAAKLRIMKDSVMAHPVARLIFEAQGHNEASIYWNDTETNELCRIRPDRMPLIPELGPLVVDVKKVDGLDRFDRHVSDFRYHVQDAMYTDGYRNHFGETPDFLFLIVSSSISAGRYGVDVVRLPEDWKQDGHDLYRRDLQAYAACRQTDDWLHVRTLNRPRWA